MNFSLVIQSESSPIVFKMKVNFNQLKYRLREFDNFQGYFRYLEFWLTFQGSNIFNKKWFRKENLKIKLLCVFFTVYLVFAFVFSVISAICTYLDDNLDDALSAVIGALFTSHVSFFLCLVRNFKIYFQIFKLLIKYWVLMYKHKSYRLIKNSAVNHIEEALNGSNLMYRPIFFKYERYAK